MSDAGGGKGGATIVLLVEDNVVNRFTVGRALRGAGYDVREADNGHDALLLAALRGQVPELAVVDRTLPDMSGYELCRRLKSGPEHASLPVLLLSATRESAAAADGESPGDAGGPDGYLVHPVESAELLATVKALLRQRQAEQLLSLQSQVLEHVADAVVAIDNEFRVIFCNVAAERLYGLAPGAAVGRKLDEVYRFGWLAAGDEAAFSRAISTGRGWTGECLHVRADGGELRVEAALGVLKGEQGARLGLLSVARRLAMGDVAARDGQHGLEAQRLELDAARKSVEAHESEAAAARARVEAARAEAEAARAQTRLAQADMEAAQKDARAARDEAERSRVRADAAVLDAARAREEVEAARGDAARSAADLTVATRTSDAARAAAEAARHEAASARAETEAAHAEAASARADATTARAVADTAQADATTARAETAALRAAAASSLAEAATSRALADSALADSATTRALLRDVAERAGAHLAMPVPAATHASAIITEAVAEAREVEVSIDDLEAPPATPARAEPSLDPTPAARSTPIAG